MSAVTRSTRRRARARRRSTPPPVPAPRQTVARRTRTASRAPSQAIAAAAARRIVPNLHGAPSRQLRRLDEPVARCRHQRPPPELLAIAQHHAPCVALDPHHELRLAQRHAQLLPLADGESFDAAVLAHDRAVRQHQLAGSVAAHRRHSLPMLPHELVVPPARHEANLLAILLRGHVRAPVPPPSAGWPASRTPPTGNSIRRSNSRRTPNSTYD